MDDRAGSSTVSSQGTHIMNVVSAKVWSTIEVPANARVATKILHHSTALGQISSLPASPCPS